MQSIPFYYIDDENMLLVDCGYTGFLPAIEQAMIENNLYCGDLTHVLITHQDHDHIGAMESHSKKFATHLLGTILLTPGYR